MKKLCILAAALFVLLIPISAECRGVGGEGSGSVPRVAYSRPYDQSVVDVSDGKPVVFQWAMVPIPSNSRDSYRLVLHKGSGYDVVVSKVIDPGVYSIEVPAEKLENGMQYWWYVRQRDARTMAWSEYDIWYFKVTKK